jgi:RNA polymerase sigma-70 factor (ECF subfamily)
MISSSDAVADDWLTRFHAGDHTVMEACYREHFATVDRAVRPFLSGADRETVVHEVFFRLLSSTDLRRAFQGRSLAAWLATVARNHTIDYLRKRRREQPMGALEAPPETSTDARWEERAQARMLVERFRHELLPAKWGAVFEARFLRQLPQREAAKALGMHRTTLAYQEHRIRRLLRKFLLGQDGPGGQGGEP